jgi:hypothetical protein
MSDMKTAPALDIEERSYLAIDDAVLIRLGAVAGQDREDFFRRNPRWERLYRDRVLCVALCQGAALHFIDGRNGVRDWDVWTFFRLHSEGAFPPRQRGESALGDSRFGRSMVRSEYLGRCVDLIGRSIIAEEREDPVAAVHRYLSSGRTESARRLAQKAVVLLEPVHRRGEVVWPLNGTRHAVLACT